MMPHIRRVGEDKIETLRGRLLLREISLHDVKAALAPEILGGFRKQADQARCRLRIRLLFAGTAWESAE